LKIIWSSGESENGYHRPFVGKRIIDEIYFIDISLDHRVQTFLEIPYFNFLAFVPEMFAKINEIPIPRDDDPFAERVNSIQTIKSYFHIMKMWGPDNYVGLSLIVKHVQFEIPEDVNALGTHEIRGIPSCAGQPRFKPGRANFGHIS
jgi:hypothetical protein